VSGLQDSLASAHGGVVEFVATPDAERAGSWVSQRELGDLGIGVVVWG